VPTMDRKKRLDPLVQAHRDGSVFPTTRHAYYIASSAVTSAAINDMPDLATIRRDGSQFGRVRYNADAGPQSLTVVRLSGLAGVQLLTGENFTAELSLACGEACLSAERTPRHRGRDSIEAVAEILRVERGVQGLALFERVKHYFDATRVLTGARTRGNSVKFTGENRA
jgi:hypothetical protein